MRTFIKESLKPAVFWTALAAIGTLSAVLIALFLPAYNEVKRVEKVVRLIDGEITRNCLIAKIATSEHTITLPDGSTQQVALSIQETERLFNFELWKQYKYKLADDRPEIYEKYQRIYQHVDALSDLDQVPETLRLRMFRDEISSFVQKCQDELKLD